MPTRKQRRRREKDFRHDVRVYEVDGEGNEVPIAELRARDPKPAKAPAKQAGRGRARTMREVSPPSWDRAMKRGGLMGGLMVVVFWFVERSVQGLAIGLFYGVAFVPLTYWIDRTAYRSYLKRSGRAAAKQ
ncbi:MAG TPA: hypothetical protein VGC78_13245 [Gaiellaceae bacterium]|jgi:hypothetical protein